MKVKLTLDDYRKWNFWHYFIGIMRKIFAVIAVLFFACMTLFVILSKLYGHPVSVTMIALALVVLFVLVYFALKLQFRPEKFHETGRMPQEEIMYVIDEKRLKIQTKDGASDTAWDKIYGANLGKTYIAINSGKGRNYILPDGCFKDKSQLQELADLLAKVLLKGRVKGHI